MKLSKSLVALFLGGILIAVLIKLDVIDVYMSPATSMQIPSVEFQSVVEKAKAGDLDSTGRLVNHFLIFEGDEKTALIWARLGAEQGDQDLRKFVVDVLSISTLDADQAESKRLAAQWRLPVR